MTRCRTGRREALGLAAGLLLAGLPARAQAAPLRMLVPFPAGTTPDTLARLYGGAIAGPLGQPVVVENRTGVVAPEAVARALPDGNTLFVGGNGPISINKHLTDRLPYDPDRDFRPVAFLGLSMQALVARPGLAASLAAFLAAARAAEINYGSVGAGSASHLLMAGLAAQTGLRAQHIPYRGGPQALLEVVSGRIDALVTATGTALPAVREGQVVPLAVTGPGRDPLMPDVPSFEEAGIPGFVLPVWNALFAPRAAPDAAVGRVARAVAAARDDAAVRRGVAAAGFSLEARDPAAMAGFIEAESRRWGEIARATGVRLTD